MTLERWNPFAEMRRMDEALNRIWHGGASGVETDIPWAAPVDVVRDGDDIIVRASLPGVEVENIDVTVEGEALTIKAQSAASSESGGDGYLLKERRTGSFHRSLALPESVDFGNAESSYKDGVLTVKLPKRESAKSRRLEVVAS